MIAGELTEAQREEKMAKMRERMERQNEETRQQTECEVCGDPVPEVDFDKKFMQAGGALSGPFCSAECFWDFLA